MPREFSTSVQGEIDKHFAGEPMTIVEVSWTDDAWVAYSDRKLSGEDYPHPDILSVSGFDTTTIVSGGASDRSIGIVLVDTSGDIREIIDSKDAHLRPVRIYLTFQGLPFSEKALMFEGVINSPVVWSETDRTLKFEVLSKLEDAEAGFMMEDGDFPAIPEDQRNQAWPMVFGQVCNMKPVQANAGRKAYLGEGVGLTDPTLKERLCQIQNTTCPRVATKKTIPGGSYYDGYNLVIRLPKDVWYSVVDINCQFRQYYETCKLLVQLQSQSDLEKSQFIVRGGEEFPQNQSIKIKIKEAVFTGTMVGELFSVTGTYHPDQDIENPPCRGGWEDYTKTRIVPTEAPTHYTRCSTGFTSDGRDSWFETGADQPFDRFKDFAEWYEQNSNLAGWVSPLALQEFNVAQSVKYSASAAASSWKYYNAFKSGGFLWLPAGEEVFLMEDLDNQDYNNVNIVSLMPGSVDQVSAYRTYGATTLLTEVPTEHYTVITSDFGAYDVVEVRMHTKLSNIENENWEDQIYVSFTSSVGPNPVDSIRWLIDKYTEYGIDEASFIHVRHMLRVYPSNFFVKDRPKVLELVKDIAFQARCAVFIRQNKVHIVYLPQEPESLKTLGESDILQGSFSFTHTETEKLETRHKITWSDGEAGIYLDDPVDYELILKHNVPQYGIFDAEYNYYTQNTFSTIEKSATFWMIRKAKTWRYVEFETSGNHLDLDVFDCVTLDIGQFPTVKVIIEHTLYNAESHTIRFKAWTPILSGDTSPYYWAWPSQKSPYQVFPLPDEQDTEGDGSDLIVVPPSDHPLYNGYDPDREHLDTDGDKHPSDINDTFPHVVCKIATGYEISGIMEPNLINVDPMAQRNWEQQVEETQSSMSFSAGGSSEDEQDPPQTPPPEKNCDEEPEEDAGCRYSVNLYTVTPSSVTTNPSTTGVGCGAGPCSSTGTGDGVCTGPGSSNKYYFDSYSGAKAFSVGKKAEAERCGFTVGQPRLYIASDPVRVSGGGGDCADPNYKGGSSTPVKGPC